MTKPRLRPCPRRLPGSNMTGPSTWWAELAWRWEIVAMDDAGLEIRRAARERAYSIPLAEIEVADDELFRTDTFWPYFERLRKEDPVHRSVHPEHGPYWSITKYNDI